ncbi:trans-sulfuration enzyme family protein [Aporhodopirellula aestuarii]|uniref:PLP-dependent aspartate aminotransferase family protein n=1 Tax=Aporhodopirellula aestuarii TaxID=2950107 RepID=A0ABT0U2V2_9BACT|nr:PLP-dependent aspartate aminotransferase family protein [Aporhodopirellula aestuarii]MCM2371219.1 PLP-dependent aspartate aminotransferase family protein [Aporhodopirellula aestuarii]
MSDRHEATGNRLTNGFRTRAIHVGGEVDPATGAVVPPIHFASTFRQPGAGQWGEYDYSRSGNPTRTALQTTLASLESENTTQCAGALAFSSGMAAIHAVTMLLRSGDHVVAGTDIYGGAYRLLHRICDASGIRVTLVDMTDLEAVEAAISPDTKLIWGETVGNPRLTIPDLPAIARIAKRHGILTGVDNTFGTPALMRPLSWGIDIVMHSATKYLGGHSDCLGGTLAVADQDLLDRLYFIQNATGAVLDPMSCFLVSRGLKTLDLRIREQSATAMKLATWLETHERVRSVIYPGLDSHPQSRMARRLFDENLADDQKRFGAMITFELDGSLETVRNVCQNTRLFHLAVSLGAVESLIEQPATMSHASYAAEDRAKHGITDSLIRLSVGLEHVDDLKNDLQQAFEAGSAE